MPGNAGKKAAAGAAAVALAGGVAHFSGAFTDDAIRAAGRGTRIVDKIPTPRLPVNDPIPPVGGARPLEATDDLVREGENDITKKDIICFAYGTFVDSETGEFAAPSETEFVTAVAEALAAHGSQLAYRLEADSLYETLSDPEADLMSVAEELAC